MKIYKLKWLFLVLLIFLLLIFVMTRRQLRINGMTCIKPFHEFAYLPDETPRPISEVLPGHSWQVEATIPGPENATDSFSDIQIELARTKNGEGEIWLYQHPLYSQDGTVSKEGSFTIYHPQSQTWGEVPALIGDTNLAVSKLFVASDGTVWGGISIRQPHPISPTDPVLGRFNESTQQFEAAVGGLEIPITVEQGLISELIEIVLDKEDIFWIFGPDDSIYRYDPEAQTTERYAGLPRTDMVSLSTALASDGSIYFRDSFFSEAEELLFQFFPETREFVALEVPREPWDFSGGLLVDHRDRLWLGAMGYMERDGSLHLLHRNALKAWENRSEFLYWSLPTLLFESSNGLLWYAEYHDMSLLGEGTAWYDPETGEGCLFTNLASNIVEDAEKQLWMVANGKLYRYSLE